MLVAIFLLIALVTLAMSTEVVRVWLQKVIYGSPIKLCINDLYLQAGEDWSMLSLKAAPDRQPLIYGLFPWVSSKTDFGVDSGVQLVSVTTGGIVSIRSLTLPQSNDQLVADCSSNEHCAIVKSKLDGLSTVTRIQSGNTRYSVSLDGRVSVLYDLSIADFDGLSVTLEGCKGDVPP